MLYNSVNPYPDKPPLPHSDVSRSLVPQPTETISPTRQVTDFLSKTISEDCLIIIILSDAQHCITASSSKDSNSQIINQNTNGS